MKWFWVILLATLVVGCATSPAEVTYQYHYSIYLMQSEGSTIGNIELLLETSKQVTSDLDTEATSTPTVSPTLSIPLK